MLGWVLMITFMSAALRAQLPVPLEVRLTAPAMNQLQNTGSTMALAAELSGQSDGAVTVQFFNGKTLLGTANAAPYKLSYGNGQLAAGNYSLIARATDAKGHRASSLPVTVTVAALSPRPLSTFEYSQEAEDRTQIARLSMPKDLAVVRGLLVKTNASSGDTRDGAQDAYISEFLHEHGFAYVGTKAFNSRSADVLLAGLEQFAKETGHAEMLQAPVVLYGFSAGGGFANAFLVRFPERVIASAPCLAWLPAQESPALLATPVCLMCGEQETRLVGLMQTNMALNRAKGARFAWMTVQGVGPRRG
jgi:hypothetical protein